MKTKLFLTIATLLTSLSAVFAQLNTGGDGSDGAFTVPYTSTPYYIDLRNAVAGDGVTIRWDTPQTAANQGKGIYDPVRHAVVFKYSSVHIPSLATVAFINHPSHAPVVWLVSGSVVAANVPANVSVNIEGKLFLNGGSSSPTNTPTEPGPGGFRGGAAGSPGSGAGLGIAGGIGYSASGNYALGTNAYGNPSIIPLIGGSGAAARGSSIPGGGGGGAILIGAANSIRIFASTSNNGLISATGGSSGTSQDVGGGGAIRLVANSLVGNGTLDANSTGRIRLESDSVPATFVTTPQTIAVHPNIDPMTNTVAIWPGSTAPSVRIVKVSTAVVPAYPPCAFGYRPRCRYFHLGQQPRSRAGGNAKLPNHRTSPRAYAAKFPAPAYSASFSDPTPPATVLVAGSTESLATWQITIPSFIAGFTTLQAIATVP